MISSVKRLELMFWALLPALLTIALIVLSLVPKHLGGLGSVMPLLPLMPIFYWGMSHAREMPYWFAFAAGVLMDAATGLPLGLSSLLLIIFLALLHAQRKYIHKEGFLIKWGYFSVLLLVYAAMSWLCLSLLYARMLAVVPALVQWLLSVGMYPFLHVCFERIDRHIHERRWRVLHGR